MTLFPALSAALLLSSSIFASAAVPKPETLAAWRKYIAAADSRTQAASTGNHFLWLDDHTSQKADVQRGKVVATQFKPAHEFSVPDGWIHDWIGDVFIPHTTLQNVLDVVRDYRNYPKWYGPTIIQAASSQRQPRQRSFHRPLLEPRALRYCLSRSRIRHQLLPHLA